MPTIVHFDIAADDPLWARIKEWLDRQIADKLLLCVSLDNPAAAIKEIKMKSHG